MLYSCCFSYWLANKPSEFEQLRWAAGMGDKTQLPTSIVVQVLWVARRRTRTRCAAAKPAYPTGAESSKLGLLFKGFFFLIFLSICMVIFISTVVFPAFCKLMAFFFHFLFVFKLNDWLFTFANLFEVANSFRIIFSRLLANLQSDGHFNFINRLMLFLPSKLGLPVC